MSPRRIAWFNCFAGIAGDMALGSLVDAGADTRLLMRILEQLPIGGWSLEFEPVMRNGIAATHAVVGVRGDSVVRTWMHIQGVLEEARLPDRVRDRAIAAFGTLAEVEGRLHRRAPSHVHFHEVGGHDTIIDIVGTAAALELLEIDEVASGPVATGIGTIRSAHGLIPNPAPAVVGLLEGIPTVGRDLNVELTTPTGATILKAWGTRFGAMPAMTIECSGFGAGTREIDGMPNCTQVVVGTTAPAAGEALVPDAGQPLVILEANLDDATGERLATAVEQLMAGGALDAWITPIVMKKGRPAHLVTALCDVALSGQLADLIRTATGSLGVRAHEVARWSSPREVGAVEVDGERVRVKMSPGRIKAEHADVVRAASRLGRPMSEVAARAEVAWRERSADVVQLGSAPDEDPAPTPA